MADPIVSVVSNPQQDLISTCLSEFAFLNRTSLIEENPLRTCDRRAKWEEGSKNSKC